MIELPVRRISFLLPVRICAVLDFFVRRAIRREEVAHLPGRRGAELLAQGGGSTRNTRIVFHLSLSPKCREPQRASAWQPIDVARSTASAEKTTKEAFGVARIDVLRTPLATQCFIVT